MNIKKFRRMAGLKPTMYAFFLFFAAITVAYGSEKNWEDYQKEYMEKVSAMSGEEIKETSVGIKVIGVPDLGTHDHCTTCHIALDDLRMFGEKNPLKPHPSSYLQQHPPERFGCTICHGGQGEALSVDKAQSGTFKKGDLVQVSCSSCHSEAALEGAPKVTRGKSFLKENKCTNCHYLQDLSETEDFRPAPVLTSIGDKVDEKWLWRWLKNPKGYMPNATMPRYAIDEKYVDASIGYLMDVKAPRMGTDFKFPEGDVDKGKSVLRMAFCISCHPFNGRGGKEAGDLGRIGNKLQEKWLVQMLANPHAFQPNTPMPQYNLSLQKFSDIAAYLIDEFTDYDMLDEDENIKLPAYWASPKERSEIGRRVYKELRCANCHGLMEKTGWWRKIGPELTLIGDKRISEINFGNSKTPRTLPDYIFEKIRNPQTYATPSNFMKMPNFDLQNGDIRDIVLALLSFNADKVTVGDYRFQKADRKKPETAVAEIHLLTETESKKYEPEGKFGRLVDKFRCFSCHTFNGRGHNISYDLTSEGSRVQGEWLFNYLKLPYTIRPILTIRMPIFNMTDEEAKILTGTFMRKMVNREIKKDPAGKPTAEIARQGKKLFKEKGCLACHQVGKRGGYVGPSFTQGAFVGKKLKTGWTYKWLKGSRAMLPDVLEPDYTLSDQQALALTAYLMSIESPDRSGLHK